MRAPSNGNVLRLSRPRSILIAAFVALLLVAPALGAGRGEPGPVSVVRVDLVDREAELKVLAGMDMDIDAVFDGWARVYVVPEEITKLRAVGFQVTEIPDPGRPQQASPDDRDAVRDALVPTAYHTYETLTSELQTIAADHADIVRLESVGQTIQGRELWMVKITDNPDLEEDEPELAYISSMHGDEVVGKEMCVNLINQLTDDYGTDPRVTDLVDGNELWIMPSMNPDGTALGQRYNADSVDLNRNFPDWFFDRVDTPDGREPETGAIMNWMLDRRIVLAANFHGGELVANYPFDNNETNSSVFSPTDPPDHDALVSISRTYADSNLPMYNNSGGSFDHGITNGAAWYAVIGGMQDWHYTFRGGFHVTMEIGTKWPSGTTLPTYWSDNQESMLAYLERGAEGVRGIVTDSVTGLPVAAEMTLDGNPFPVRTDPDVGDYHRIVLPGSYSMAVSATGYLPQVIPVVVSSGPAARYDVALVPRPTDLEPIGSRVEDGGDGWIDAGESADLAVTLTNLGEATGAVSATIVPTGWYVAASRPDAGFPPIGTAESAESNAPYFGIVTDPALPAGHKVGFAIRWTSDKGSGVTDPFYLEVGAPTCQDTAALDVPQPIADYQTTTSQLVAAAGIIDEIRIPIDLTHTYIGDLQIALSSPSGTTVLLHDRSGGTTDDIVGTYGDDLTPAESLAAFQGEDAAGTWTLTVSDKAGGDTGTLNAWTLHACGRPLEAAVPEMKWSGITWNGSGTLLEWWPYPGMGSYRVYRATDPSLASSFVDVTAEDADPTDTAFADASTDNLVFFLVTGVSTGGEEGPKGHFGE